MKNSLLLKIIIGVGMVAGLALAYWFFSGGDALDINMRVPKGQWRWDPNEVTIPANKRVNLHIYNEDSYEHGFAISALNVDSAIPPQKETVVKLPPAQPGEYEFFCSVLCGEGHSGQTGKLIVK